MSLSVRVAAYGDEAFAELSRALATAQAGDPLRLVTVVVRRGPVGLAVRRRLAASPPGVVNVRFLTLGRLAGELAAPSTVGRPPASRAVVHEAARLVFAERATGLLASAKEQPATVRALVRTYGELRGASPAALAALAGQSRRAAEVVDLVGAVRQRLVGHVDEAAVVAAAVAVLAGDPAASTLAGHPIAATTAATGPVVVYLPRFARPTDRALVYALAEHVPVTVVVGSTGDREIDAADLRPWPAATRPAAVGSATPATGTEVLVAPTADAEILLAVRRLMAANAAGTPLERMAVVHGGATPYPRLVHDTLEAAGVPFNGPGVRSLAATVAGRTLIGLFDLVDHGWRRDEVTSWLTSAPLRHRGRPVPATAWDVLSAEAGVVAGLAEWVDRPAAHAAGLRERAATAPDGGSGWDRAADRGEWLSSFMAELGRHVAAAPTTWAGWAGWAKDRLDQLLGGPSSHGDWPDREVAALEAVVDVLGGLAGLDDLGGSRPGPADFRAALSAELDAPAPQTSRFGRGRARRPGRRRRRPRPRRPLRRRHGRGRVPGTVGRRRARARPRAGGVRRRAAAAGGPDGRRPPGLPRRPGRRAGPTAVVRVRRPAAGSRAPSVPAAPRRAGDRRRGRTAPPCRRRRRPLDRAGVRARAVSFGAAMAGPAGFDEPVSEVDWDLQHLLRWTRSGRRLARHFLAADDAVLARGLELRRGRRGARFSRFDGRLDDVVVATPAGVGPVQSATGLESFAACPRRYLFAHVLGIDAAGAPGGDPADAPVRRGNLVHRILERFVGRRARPAARRAGRAGNAVGPRRRTTASAGWPTRRSPTSSSAG